MAKKQRKMQEVVDDLKPLCELEGESMTARVQPWVNKLLLEAIVNLSNANAQLLERVEHLENYGGGPGMIGGSE